MTIRQPYLTPVSTISYVDGAPVVLVNSRCLSILRVSMRSLSSAKANVKLKSAVNPRNNGVRPQLMGCPSFEKYHVYPANFPRSLDGTHTGSIRVHMGPIGSMRVGVTIDLDYQIPFL